MMLKKLRRKGAIAVEFAVVMPVIFLFFFGLWEWSRVEMIRQVSETAVFEAARTGTLPGSTDTDAETKALEILDVYMISGATVDATVNATESTVTLEVPLDQNTWISSQLYGGKAIHTGLTFQK